MPCTVAVIVFQVAQKKKKKEISLEILPPDANSSSYRFQYFALSLSFCLAVPEPTCQVWEFCSPSLTHGEGVRL